VRAEFNADRRSGPASASPITEIQAAMRPPETSMQISFCDIKLVKKIKREMPKTASQT
jgi:hypothetical protein